MNKSKHLGTWLLVIINIWFGLILATHGWSHQLILQVGGISGNMPTSQGLYQFLPFYTHNMTDIVRHLPFMAFPITGVPLIILRTLSASFLHFSWVHLLGNTMVLLIIGKRFEDINYKGLLVLVYIVTGITSMTTVYLYQPQALTVGASGAIFGIMGASLAFALKAKIAKKKYKIPNNTAIEYIKEGKMIYGLIAMNLIITFLVPGISIIGHISGLVSGIIMGMLLPLKYY